jgi:hypothetical protein
MLKTTKLLNDILFSFVKNNFGEFYNMKVGFYV